MEEDRRQKLEAFLRRWGLEVTELELIDLALTHPTYALEHNLPGHNQRLEFLGDAVLGLAVAEYLYRELPALSEGELTRLRAAIVCEASLAQAARTLGLGELLLLGRGEEQTGGRQRPSNLAEALEAFFGSLYLTAGFPAVKKLVERLFTHLLEGEAPWKIIDSKSRLQEWIQKKGPENVSYRLLAQWGPDHDKRFRCGVFYRGKLLATGEGKSKKEAEQEAARKALEHLGEHGLLP